MEEIVPTALVLVLWGILIARGQYSKLEQRFLLLSFVAHIVSVVLTIDLADASGGGDLIGYLFAGRLLARGMRDDFFSYVPHVVGLLFHSEDPFPVFGADDFAGIGTSTGSLKAIAGFVMLLVNDSRYAASMLITLPSFFGKIALYRVFQDSFPRAERPRLLIATVLVPSVIFWSCGLVKEGIVVASLGWILLGVRRFFGGQLFTGGVLIAIPSLFVGLIKPYVLFPLVLAAGIWLYWGRIGERNGRVLVRPAFLLVGVLISAGGIAALSSVFPEYAVTNLGEQSAHYQELGELTEGGSNYTIGDAAERSLAGQLAFAPLALGTALFRPFIFEVRNATMAAAALEMLIILVLIVRTLWRRSWRETVSDIWRSPVMMFCSVFVLLFGTAVGLVSTNLGTLTRYRAPLMPFYATLVLILARRATVGIEAEEAPEDETESSESTSDDTVGEPTLPEGDRA